MKKKASIKQSKVLPCPFIEVSKPVSINDKKEGNPGIVDVNKEGKPITHCLME